MNKILTTDQAAGISKQLRTDSKTIVLAGGCFDILHTGHLAFIKAAKKQGDVLFIFLESDDFLREKKGQERPINTQKERASMLAQMENVDYVVLLPNQMTNEDYDRLVVSIKPAIIATTQNDPGKAHKKRQAGVLGIRVVDVIQRIPGKSTSALINRLIAKRQL